MYLADGDLKLVRQILRHHLPGEVHVAVYGSRSHGRNLKPYSDLDICLRGATAIDTDVIVALRWAFQDSDLPFKVDVVDWGRLAPDFRAAISGDLVPLPVYEILKAGHDQ